MSEISVLIATHNGADLLRRTLEGYIALGPQPFDWQVIVIDNASTDDTPKVLEAFKDKLPLITEYEPQPGKNRALNLGVKHISAPRVILSDNDSIPHAGFLEKWVAAFDAAPETDVFGGSITPWFDTPMPQWMLDEKPRFIELYALRENIPDGPIGADYIFGPNMAVRKKLFDDGLIFDEDVGPNSSRSNYAMGSETAYCRAAESAGYKLGFASAPCVYHIVRPNQTTEAFREKRAYRLGLGTARKHWIEGAIKPHNPTGLRMVVRAGLRGMKKMAFLLSQLLPNPAKRFDAAWNFHFYRGYQDGVDGLRQQNAQDQRSSSLAVSASETAS